MLPERSELEKIRNTLKRSREILLSNGPRRAEDGETKLDQKTKKSLDEKVCIEKLAEEVVVSLKEREPLSQVKE